MLSKVLRLLDDLLPLGSESLCVVPLGLAVTVHLLTYEGTVFLFKAGICLVTGLEGTGFSAVTCLAGSVRATDLFTPPLLGLGSWTGTDLFGRVSRDLGSGGKAGLDSFNCSFRADTEAFVSGIDVLADDAIVDLVIVEDTAFLIIFFPLFIMHLLSMA